MTCHTYYCLSGATVENRSLFTSYRLVVIEDNPACLNIRFDFHSCLLLSLKNTVDCGAHRRLLTQAKEECEITGRGNIFIRVQIGKAGR